MAESNPQQQYVRDLAAVVFSAAGVLSVLPRGGVRTTRFAGAEAIAARTLAEACVHAMTRLELEQVAASAQLPTGISPQAFVDRLLASGLLVAADASAALVDADDRPPLDCVVAGVCGSVAATLAPAVLYRIRRQLCSQLEVVLTASAARFVQPYALETLADARVWRDTFERSEAVRTPHIHLAARAELVLVMPCTARALSSFASTRCDDLLGLVVAATRAPVVLVPVMNAAMWTSVGVRRNVDAVRELGMVVVEPGAGLEVGEAPGEQHRQLGGQGVYEHNVVPAIDAILDFVAHSTDGN